MRKNPRGPPPLPKPEDIEYFGEDFHVYCFLFLPGKEAEFEENNEVPHGQIRKVWYHSKTLGMQRRMHVYTPPNYDDSSDRYPVFYLLHGGGDEDFALDGAQSLDEILKKYGIRHEFHLSGGGHTWINWRHYLNDLAPRLF